MNINNMDTILVLFLLSLPTAAPNGSHSFWVLATYIKGQSPFPQFSYTLMLDDVRLLYYNGETKTFIRRGNTTNEDTVLDPNVLFKITDYIEASFIENSAIVTQNLNKTNGALAFQKLVLCELKDNGEPGQMITRRAFEGSTTDELRYIENSFTFQGSLNITAEVLKIHLDISMWRHEYFYYPACIKTLKAYLEKRRIQVNRKVKPKVRLLHNKLSFGPQVSCLATGFYPRHINLTLFRDGQPVTDDVTGGDLLPNDDGTYQMRKILKISAEEQREKHKYTCTATHLILDNKLDITLEFDHGTPIKPVISFVLTVLALLFGIVAAVTIWRKRYAVQHHPLLHQCPSTPQP
ncbi:putative hereditary hemochromatosis protein-like protein [Triplophysa rosa]|uniref:Hereditary hemochromatosis protein-like protein n=1 Tax=Triplophysa rosa TaxID=992332 RepID=A0A9W7X1E0_TRIRA|nr:putative hereditary hemochromatosis protein-like protein [Triplophysa rosa]